MSLDVRQPGAIAGGIGLLLAGVWLLADILGAPLAGPGQMWPGLLVLAGAAMLIQHLARQRGEGGLAFVGLGMTLMGAFLCVFALRLGGLTWPSMAQYWPALLIIVGAMFVGTHVLDGMRSPDLLVPGYLIGGLGLFLLPITLGIVPGPIFNQIVQLSPIPVALALLAMFFRPPGRNRRAE